MVKPSKLSKLSKLSKPFKSLSFSNLILAFFWWIWILFWINFSIIYNHRCEHPSLKQKCILPASHPQPPHKQRIKPNSPRKKKPITKNHQIFKPNTPLPAPPKPTLTSGSSRRPPQRLAQHSTDASQPTISPTRQRPPTHRQASKTTYKHALSTRPLHQVCFICF